jgi:hypothetical protein
MKKTKITLDEQQRQFLKNYQRMTLPELEQEMRSCEFGSIGWQYCQMEFQIRTGQLEVVEKPL